MEFSTSLHKRVQILEQWRKEAMADITALQTALTTLQNDVATMTSAMSAEFTKMEGEIATLNQTIAGLQAGQVPTQADIDALTVAVGNIDASIKTAQAAIPTT